MVFSEYLTKWVEAFPVPSIEAPVIARLLVDEIFTRHGAPRTLLSDRGSNFLPSLVTEVCRLLNTKKVNTTAYHPQTDGLVEREAISSYVSSNQLDWDVYIPAILFAYRTSPCVSTGDTPFYLLYGREPRLAPDVSLLPPSQLSSSVEEHRARIARRIEAAQSIVRANIARTQQLMKLQYDKTSDNAPFEIGQRVWIFYLIFHADVYISRAAIAYVCSLFKQFSLRRDSASIRQMNQPMLFFRLCLFFAQIKF